MSAQERKLCLSNNFMVPKMAIKQLVRLKTLIKLQIKLPLIFSGPDENTNSTVASEGNLSSTGNSGN